MKNIIGQIVEKENFFGRNREIKDAERLLEDGNSLLLAAPRRVGKSSFARKMIEVTESKGWKGYFIDLEQVKSEEDFIKRFLILLKGENWWEKFPLKNFSLSVGQIGVSLETGKQNDIYYEIEKVLPHHENTLIVMDELTIFLNNLHGEDGKNGNCERFLNWLRGLRLATGTKIRWIICSSISIESFAHRHNFSYTINDFTNFKIDELEGGEPALLVKELAKSKEIVFGDEEIHYLLEKIGWKLPYYIQLLLKEIGESAENGIVAKNTVDVAYQKATSRQSVHFNTWIERLKNFEENKSFAEHILKELAKTPNGKSKTVLKRLIYNKINDDERAEEILNHLLLALENDGYLMSKNGKYAFRSPLLREFWYNRYIQ